MEVLEGQAGLECLWAEKGVLEVGLGWTGEERGGAGA